MNSRRSLGICDWMTRGAFPCVCMFARRERAGARRADLRHSPECVGVKRSHESDARRFANINDVCHHSQPWIIERQQVTDLNGIIDKFARTLEPSLFIKKKKRKKKEKYNRYVRLSDKISRLERLPPFVVCVCIRVFRQTLCIFYSLILSFLYKTA